MEKIFNNPADGYFILSSLQYVEPEMADAFKAILAPFQEQESLKLKLVDRVNIDLDNKCCYMTFKIGYKFAMLEVSISKATLSLSYSTVADNSTFAAAFDMTIETTDTAQLEFAKSQIKAMNELCLSRKEFSPF